MEIDRLWEKFCNGNLISCSSVKDKLINYFINEVYLVACFIQMQAFKH